METVDRRGLSRKYRRKDSHFRTVRFGGFEEGQVLCYLWEIVKTLETEQDSKPAQSGTLKKQIRSRVRVEMRRYFARRRRRNMKMLAGTLAIALSMGCLFGFVIGIDRVSGTSMYPYLNDRDWIVYSRIGGEIRRDDVVVFEKNGEVMVKRVAGLPGDRVEMNPSGNQIIVNGAKIKEEYITITKPEDRNSEAEPATTQVVMNGQYLVLGDNRAESVDSRDSNIGTVSAKQVLGKVIWIFRDGR